MGPPFFTGRICKYTPVIPASGRWNRRMENWRPAWVTERDHLKKKELLPQKLWQSSYRLSSQEKGSVEHDGLTTKGSVLSLIHWLVLWRTHWQAGEASFGRACVLSLQLKSGGQSLQLTGMCLSVQVTTYRKGDVLSREKHKGIWEYVRPHQWPPSVLLLLILWAWKWAFSSLPPSLSVMQRKVLIPRGPNRRDASFSIEGVRVGWARCFYHWTIFDL